MPSKPDISKRAFWDVDFEQLDFDKNAPVIIIRVLERGTYDDMISIMKYYGEERLIGELTSAPHLSPRIVNFISAVFDVEPKEFRCTQSN